MSKEEQIQEENKEEVKKVKPKHHIRGIWAVTLILILAAILAGAVWYFVLSDSGSNVFSISHRRDKKAEEEKKKEEEAKKGLKNYTNLSALFSFDYPNTWVLGEQNNSLILSSDTSYSAAYLAGQNPELKDSDIYIQIHFSNEEIDISREAPGGIKAKKTTAKIGSVEVTKTTYKNDDTFAEIISNFKAGDFLFTIICDSKAKNKDLIESYNKMLASFKFGKEVIEEKNK